MLQKRRKTEKLKSKQLKSSNKSVAAKSSKNRQPNQISRYARAIHLQESNSQRLDRWLDSLNSLLGEIASIEVNTSVVPKITTEKFMPWQAYLELFAISRTNLENLHIHSSLQGYYLSLRRQLELEYSFLLINPQSELYEQEQSKQIKRDLALLVQPNDDWEIISSRLPDPFESDDPSIMIEVHKLLRNFSFLRTLRKLRELKSILDRRNQFLWQAKSVDTVFAQTKIQLGGQISNCYAQKLLSHPHKQSLLKLHQEGVEAGEKHWQRLLEFLITIAHKYQG